MKQVKFLYMYSVLVKGKIKISIFSPNVRQKNLRMKYNDFYQGYLGKDKSYLLFFHSHLQPII